MLNPELRGALTHHGRSANLHNISFARSHRRLSANHTGAVREHRHAHKWETVVMPGDGREVLVGHEIHSLFHVRVLVPDRNVDVGNLKVDRGNKVDTGDF
jgi:hypothetical protein